MENKNFSKDEFLSLLKALDDRNREIIKLDMLALKQEMFKDLI